jgi:hypothetical protein
MSNCGDKNNSSLETRQALITQPPSIFSNMPIILKKAKATYRTARLAEAPIFWLVIQHKI